MKQTVVEWLVEQMFKQGYFDGNKPLTFTNLDHLQQQAKQMERELIKDSCTMAIMQWYEWDKTNYLDLYDHKIEGAEIWSEDYVKELYGEIEVPEPNKIMELFNDYTSYCQYVKEDWNDGYINELFESGYIVEKEYTGEYECASRDIEYRMLTESEFNEIFNTKDKLYTEEPEFTQISQNNPVTKGSTALIRNPKYQREMAPKEEAEELFYKMSCNSSDEDHHCSHYVAKNCALIAVDEILNVIPDNNGWQTKREYWQGVKQEIENL